MNPYQQTSAFSTPLDRPKPAEGPGTVAPEAPRKRASGLGAAGLLLAIIALLFGWIPIVGLAMLLPAVLAVALGVIGFAAASVTGRSGRGLPILATFLGAFACLIPPISTILVALTAVPWVYAVGMDQVQIELEHDLKQQGVPSEQSERVGEEIGDVLRRFADPGQWREGIALAHRFERITENFRRDLREIDPDDTVAIERRSEAFGDDLRRLARRYEVNLSEEDMDLVIDALRKQQVERVEQWRAWQRHDVPHMPAMPSIGVDSEHLLQYLDQPVLVPRDRCSR